MPDRSSPAPDAPRQDLTHVDSSNRPAMVDVSAKAVTRRVARARATITVNETVQALLKDGDIRTKKGPVFQTAIIAGTMAVKQTDRLIPFCHPMPIDACLFQIAFDEASPDTIVIDCEVGVTHKTGVEMEALTGATIAALTIYDMCKAVDRHMVIGNARILEKQGGRHDFQLES